MFIGGVLIVFLGIVVYWYNKGVCLKTYVSEAFSTMDVYLKKRWDLIPSLAECVKGYAKHESSVLSEVTKLRNVNYNQLSHHEKLQTNEQLTHSLSHIMAVVESYPELKAGTNFLTLMDQLKEIEEDIAQSRKYYNGTVRIYNTYLAVFPTNFIGKICRWQPENLFETEAEQRQNVKLNLR